MSLQAKHLTQHVPHHREICPRDKSGMFSPRLQTGELFPLPGYHVSCPCASPKQEAVKKHSTTTVAFKPFSWQHKICCVCVFTILQTLDLYLSALSEWLVGEGVTKTSPPHPASKPHTAVRSWGHPCGWHSAGDRVTLKPPGTWVGILSLHSDP